MRHTRKAKNHGEPRRGPLSHALAALRPRSDSGAVAVEFAILAPVFMIIVFGIIDYSRAIWTQAALQYAVEEAARFGMVSQSLEDSDLENAVEAKALAEYIGWPTASFSATVADTTYNTTVVRTVLITGTHAYEPFFPIVPGGARTLAAQSKTTLPLFP